jgi:hypothetical protein
VWTGSIVAQRFSQLAHRDPQAAIELDESIPFPNAALNLRPCDDFACIFQKNDQQSEWLILDSYSLAEPQEFAGSSVRYEGAESISSP